jgi:hypothetical protein
MDGQVKSGGKSVIIVAKDDGQRLEWFHTIGRKAKQLRNQAEVGLKYASGRSSRPPDGLGPEPEPEPELDASTSLLAQAQDAAGQAVSAFEKWERFWDHTASIARTDGAIASLSAVVDEIAYTNMPTVRSDSYIDAQQVDACCTRIKECRNEVARCVQAERALREASPLEMLRAVVFGCGEEYPQLSKREVYASAERFLVANDVALPTDMDVTYDAKLIELLESCTRPRLQPDSFIEAQVPIDSVTTTQVADLVQLVRATANPGLLPPSLVTAARAARELLLEEAAQLTTILARARDNNIREDVMEHAALDGVAPPDTNQLKKVGNASAFPAAVQCLGFFWFVNCYSASVVLIGISIRVHQIFSANAYAAGRECSWKKRKGYWQKLLSVPNASWVSTRRMLTTRTTRTAHNCRRPEAPSLRYGIFIQTYSMHGVHKVI